MRYETEYEKDGELKTLEIRLDINGEAKMWFRNEKSNLIQEYIPLIFLMWDAEPSPIEDRLMREFELNKLSCKQARALGKGLDI